MDICPGRRRMEQRKREWKGAQRLVNGRFKTGPPARDWRSAEHQAACSTDRVLRYSVPALAWRRTTGLQGKRQAIQAAQHSGAAKSPPFARFWAP